MTEYMLTTVDNPYNPFTEFDPWYAFDVAHGYHTCDYLARIVISSDELSDAEEDQAINDAMDEIIEMNGFAIYKKVSSDSFKAQQS